MCFCPYKEITLAVGMIKNETMAFLAKKTLSWLHFVPFCSDRMTNICEKSF
jgi:hypothetical protein